MLLRQIQYFVAVVEADSFTEAAARCYISQSAISQQIQALERELGVDLLRRQNRKFTLTAAGEHFYERGRLLLEDADRLCRQTVQLARERPRTLRVGYLKSYSGPEFHMAVAEFAQRCPDIAVEIINGNHEDLYDALRLGGVDMVFNDQRRAFFSDYVNKILTVRACCVELNRNHPLAQRETLTAADLRELACILVASRQQRDAERGYYRDTVGLRGEFQFADSLEAARLLVLSGKGYLPVDGAPSGPEETGHLRRIPLLRDGHPILCNYCAFWALGNENPYIPVFAQILEEKFSAE